MTELQPLSMTINLLGGLALFLYGMEKMTDGLKAAAGEQMNVLLAKLTGNPVSGAVTGALVTAVIQSSSVTTVLVVGFVSVQIEILDKLQRIYSIAEHMAISVLPKGVLAGELAT